MQPFRIPAQLATFSDPYPDAQLLIEIARNGGDAARIALSRLWLSEGIPYAFRECPAIYESIRTWLSTWLSVDAKEIGIAGSGRLGQSLAPKKLGNPFSNTSDLDLFIVSHELFGSLREEFRGWAFDYESGQVVAKNDREERFWQDHNSRGPKVIQRGFLDHKMIPNMPNYPITKKISQGMWVLVEKLKITPNAPKPVSASIRCYSSWESFVRQLSISLV